MARPNGMTDEEYWEYLYNADDSQLDEEDRAWYNSNTKDGKYQAPKTETASSSKTGHEPTSYWDKWRHGFRDIGNAIKEYFADDGVLDQELDGNTLGDNFQTSDNGDGTFDVNQGGETIATTKYDTWDDGAFGKTNEEILTGYKDAVDKAQKDYNDVWGAEKEILTKATKRDDNTDRTIASSLDAYDKTIDDLNNQAQGQMNAQTRANEFMNPYTQYQIDQSNKSIEGASGAKLQSLATQNKIANNTANMQGNAYNTAVNSALANANQNISNINAQVSNAGNILTNDASAEQDLIDANNDWASNNLETNTAMANVIAGTASNDKGFMGELADLVNKYNNGSK